MRVLIVTIAAAVVASSGVAATTPRFGVWGFVTRGPITPVCKAGTPCTAPAKHVRLVFSQNGRTVAQVTTDDTGKYRLPLRAGTYAVRLAVATGVGRGLEPSKARAVSTRWMRVDFSYDTGIR